MLSRTPWTIAVVAGLIAAGLLAPPAAVSQPATRSTRIGVLYPGADNEVFRANFDGFREALGAAGYVDGRNLALDLRFGDGRNLAALAGELVARRPDLVLAVARPGVVAMHAATQTLPVVALDLESDPVRSQFVTTIPRPGGNITGVFMDFPELAGKWLEILRTLVPTLTQVDVLWDPSTGPAQLEAARRAAETFKLALHGVEARSTAEIEPAFRSALQHRPQGMLVLTSPIFNSGRRLIADLAARYRLPTVLPFPGYARDGGLVSYGPDVNSMYRQAGAIALKILGGTPPAMLPVERPTRFTLSFNLKTARALTLTIPSSLRVRADEVFE